MSNINIYEILAKWAKEGDAFFCPIVGWVTLDDLNRGNITVREKENYKDAWELDSFGRVVESGLPMLWPSDNQNYTWDDYVSQKMEEEAAKQECKFNFQPFDKVLVRDGDSEAWDIEFFRGIPKSRDGLYQCMSGGYKQCIPYNDQTKDLFDTNKAYAGN